jgi:hypothetical protein
VTRQGVEELKSGLVIQAWIQGESGAAPYFQNIFQIDREFFLIGKIFVIDREFECEAPGAPSFPRS